MKRDPKKDSPKEPRRPQAAAKRSPAAAEHDDPGAVKAYLAALDHPLKAVVVAVREAILGAEPAITEGIKWNSASFYCHGWFATANVSARDSVRLVLHLGAKGRDDGGLRQSIKDTPGLLKWMSADRAIVTFTSLDDFEGKRGPFVEIVRQWAAHQVKQASPA